MRLLINEDIPKASIVTLQNTGYNIRQAKGLKDKELLEIAISQKRIIVTFDGGIGDNILNGNFSFPSGIIKLSISNFNEISPAQLLIKLFETTKIQFENHFTVVCDKYVKQRSFNPFEENLV